MARLGGAYAVFGTTDESYGIIRNVEKNKTVEENELPRGDGEVYAVEQYKAKFEYSGEYVAVAAGGLDYDDVGSGSVVSCPELDDSIYIREFAEVQTAEDWKVFRFTGSSWPHLGTLTTTTAAA